MKISKNGLINCNEPNMCNYKGRSRINVKVIVGLNIFQFRKKWTTQWTQNLLDSYALRISQKGNVGAKKVFFCVNRGTHAFELNYVGY